MTSNTNRPTAAASGWIFYAGVLLALLPILLLRDFTPDNELRYLSIIDEALRNHDFFAFHNHGIPYADKPPLYFWLLMACRLVAGKHCMWLYALVSLLPAFGVIAVLNRWCRHLIPASNRMAGRMMLMTSGYFLGAAIILRMDMLMCLFIVSALFVFWKIYEGDTRIRYKWLFPLFLFLALFTKGPLGILIPLVSTAVFLALKRQLRLFGRFWGWRTWGVLLCLCALWFFGVYADGGKEYLDNLLFHQTIDRAVDSFHHKRPFHYYLVAVWYIIAPWSLYVVGSMVADLRHPSRLPALQLFFLAIAVSTLVLLSCISSKLQIYLLPAVPFMVYSAIISLPKYDTSLLTKIAVGFPYAVFALAMPTLIVAGIFVPEIDFSIYWPCYLAAALLSAGGIWGFVVLMRSGLKKTIVPVGISLFVAIFAGSPAILQSRDFSFGYGRLCTEAGQIADRNHTADIYVWKIKRPENMDVYLGRNVIIISGDSVPDQSLLQNAILMLPEKEADRFPEAARTKVGKYVILTNE